MAIIKIRNTAIDLDAAEIPNIDASKITSGSIADARIPSLAASKITSGTFADARIAASNVSQHASSFDDNKIVNDISTLAIRQASNENKGAYNTNSMFVDVFQDSSAINLTSVSNVNEYLATVYTSKTQFVPSLHRTSTRSGTLSTPSWTGSGSVANSSGNNSTQYSGTLINQLWDLSVSWECNMYVGNSNQDGNHATMQYMGFGLMITTDTSISAGADPSIFASASDHSWYGNGSSDWSNNKLLTSDAQTAFGTSGLSYTGNDSGSGTGARAIDVSNGGRIIAGYYNDTNAWTGFRVTHDSSANTIIYRPLSWDGSAIGTPNNMVTTISNVPATGRAVFGYGDAHGNLRNFQTSYNGGNVANDDYSYIENSVTSATGNVISDAITAPSSTNKMGAIITYQDNAGTNALNTDIVLKLSADGGSNFTTATLTAMPDFASGIKMAKVNDLSVTAGTSLKYKIEFANQSSGSKEARIRGVSLQY